MNRSAPLALLIAALVAGCSGERAPAAAASSATTTAVPQHIDSVVPRDVALAQFREGTKQVDRFTGGASSRDALVHAWVKAVEANDTAALGRLRISRDEFAWLYYPTAKQGLPPYDLSPSLMWFVVDGGSNKGEARLLQDRGGKPLHVVGYTCDPQSSVEGENTSWGPCILKRVPAKGDTLEERLFGLIVERGGEWKFLSYKGRYD
jgi:hypothetical protein